MRSNIRTFDRNALGLRHERLEQIPSIELAERLANFFKGEVSEMQILYPARFQSSQNQNGFKPQEQEVNRG
ncbi:XRE family transcriptional regulator [Escherichia coli]|uniref:transcriptional regulator n=1 Tax=Escherichia coli TaxID=562 RepID=UPI0008FBE0D5|nr:transcriptional regulator [Escherichia coli]EFE8000787.1 XRE family transcriptional regulator [Escherichia coli]EFN8797355.1 XRE family transcriptional regulator [Escherichia coli]MCN2806222.1 XRE family transcriptional regulator [Escherichia coli]MCN8220987.1 XRE family transcriptional regulator [Escherichia coli]MEC6517562.1 XRE family transcriptional regulator [Escherichia coli]